MCVFVLVARQISEAVVKKALRKFTGNREIAINYLIDGEISDDPDAAEDEREAQAAAAAAAAAAVVDTTVSGASAVPAPAAAAPVRPKPRKIPIELQRLFARLQLLDTRSTTTEALTDR